MKKSRSPLFVTSLIAGAFFMEISTAPSSPPPPADGEELPHRSRLPQRRHDRRTCITLAVFIPISGWVADRFGARSVFATAVTIFTFASLLCGFTHTLTQFTLARILQGMGGAMMVPVGRLIVLRNTPKDQLTLAIAYITWPGLTALVLGPPIGGFITTYFSWHWIFFLNLPLGIVALILTLLWVENSRLDPEEHTPSTGAPSCLPVSPPPAPSTPSSSWAEPPCIGRTHRHPRHQHHQRHLSHPGARRTPNSSSTSSR